MYGDFILAVSLDNQTSRNVEHFPDKKNWRIHLELQLKHSEIFVYLIGENHATTAMFVIFEILKIICGRCGTLIGSSDIASGLGTKITRIRDMLSESGSSE